MNTTDKKPLVIFDLDGTLLDSLQDLTDSCNRALAAHGLPGHTPEQYKTYVGWGADTLIKKAMLPNTDEALYHTLRAEYDAIYQAVCEEGCRMFEGIAPLLQALHSHGVRTAVASNKPDAQTQAVCRSTFGALLDGCVGQQAGVPIKPDPAGVQGLLRRMEARCVAYVGDSDVDIHTGVNLGCYTIGVSWGMQPQEQLLAAGATVIAHTPAQLLALLLAEIEKSTAAT